MTVKRFFDIIMLCFKKNGFERAEYLKKKQIFASMGENCFWQPRNIPPESKLIKLHDNVVVASEVLFVNHDGMHHIFQKIHPESEFPIMYGAIEIESHVFIGSRCIILPNTKIEDHVIIGAGSVVSGHLESGSIYAGCPAKKIGSFDKMLERRKYMTAKGMSREDRFLKAWEDFYRKYPNP